MQISYSYLDPATAQSSIILEFTAPPDQPPHKNSRAGVRTLQTASATSPTHTRVLVDPGAGVDIDRITELTSTLDAILLTHAHYDHVRMLPAVADRFPDTPIYASPVTTELLSTLDSLQTETISHSIGEIQDRCQDPADWTTLNQTVQLTGVPAGHSPGAIGFYLEAESIATADPVSVYVTGDFTRADVAGTPGAQPLTADILCVTTSTTDDYASTLTDGLESTLEYATSQQQTVVMSTSLLGAQVTQLLGHLIEASDLGLTIVAGGSVAKTLAAADMTPPQTTLVETFTPESLLAQADIAITAPAAPHIESSATGATTLYEEVKDNSMAAIVRFCARHETFHEPLHGANCLTESHLVTGHPTEETLATFIDDVAPGTVVPMHQTGSDFRDRRDMWPRVVFAPESTTPPCVLFGGGELTLPGPLSQGQAHALNVPDTAATVRRNNSPADCAYSTHDGINAPAEALVTEQIKPRFNPLTTHSGTQSSPTTHVSVETTTETTGSAATAHQDDTVSSPTAESADTPTLAESSQAQSTPKDTTDGAESTKRSGTPKYSTTADKPLVTDGSTDSPQPPQASTESPQLPSTSAEKANAEAPPEESADDPQPIDRIQTEVETITDALSTIRTATAERRDQTSSTPTSPLADDTTTADGLLMQTVDDRLVIQLDCDPATLDEPGSNPANIASGDDITVHIQRREEED